MIQDTFDSASLYTECNPKLAQAIQFLRALSPETPEGTIEIDGEDLYAAISTYTTKPAEELSFEAHRKYIDVQVLLAGRERLDVTQRMDLPVLQPYAEDTDVMFYEAPPTYSSVVLEPGSFVVFYPQDAHRPGVAIDTPAEVKKVVVKIGV